MDLSKEQIVDSLRRFKGCRDDLLHEDGDTFEHHLDRFLELSRRDPLIQTVLKPLQESIKVDLDSWWAQATRRYEKLMFPQEADEDLLLRYCILDSVSKNPDHLFQFGIANGKHKKDEWVEIFRSVVVRPFMDELSHRLGTAADIASPEARALQAVPLERIPRLGEVKIFLSHKSVDKPIVSKYYQVLKILGFDPWLDEPNMAAGANLERELLKGFEESCAAIFFITENFKDERYLASEVDYAVIQKRKKGKKFAIITLRYPDAAEVPGLLTPYIYKDVKNDLEGFYELLRALPIELGPVRWKVEVVTT